MSEKRIISAETFKDLVTRKAPADELEDLVVVKHVRNVVKQIDVGARTIEFNISTQDADRDGDVVMVNGWQLDNYRTNPIVLWAHQARNPPIAKSLSEIVDSGVLKSTAEFARREVFAFADTIFQLYGGGFLNAVSVGFDPLRWEWVDTDERPLGIDFIEQELLEYSAVPIPANPNALVAARGKGIDTDPLKEWAEEMLDSLADLCGKTFISTHELERLRKAADSKQKTTVPVAVMNHRLRSLKLAQLRERN